MAYVIIDLKIMPDGIEADLSNIESKATEIIKGYGGNVNSTEVKPVAFGLKSLNVTLSMPEEKGGTEPLEEQIKTIDNVQNVEVLGVRRALG